MNTVFDNHTRISIFPRMPIAGHNMKIGILGGSFNPPHQGHLHISLNALKRLGLDRIWWVVSPGNPLKSHSELLPLKKRVELCLEYFCHPKIDVTAFEAFRNSPYTYNSMSFLKKRFNQTHFVWIMGADNLKSFHCWYRWNDIVNLMPIAVLDRPQYRYEAFSSRAAYFLKRFYVKESSAKKITTSHAPAWTFVNIRLNELSSTGLRQKGWPIG